MILRGPDLEAGGRAASTLLYVGTMLDGIVAEEDDAHDFVEEERRESPTAAGRS